jgi:GT2 family glycosyltransferase
MIYILLPVFNRRNITVEFIKQLLVQTYGQFHLVLIDDSSTDGTVQAALEMTKKISVINGGGNSWWGGSLQLGYEWILQKDYIKDEDIILMINDDTKFNTNYLEKGIEYSNKFPLNLIKAVELEISDNSVSYSYIHADLNKLTFKITDSEDDANCCTTRGLFMKAEVFKEIGGFFPELLPHYLSDYEYTIRASRKGFRIKSFPDLYLYFDNSTTGNNTLSFHSFAQYGSQLFSNKYVKNPKQWVNFISLTSTSWFIKYKNIVIVILQTVKAFLEAFVFSFKKSKI